jgi:hypothetical protein
VRRSLIWLAGLLLAVPLGFAQDAPPPLPEQARQLQRHGDLVAALTANALNLAAEEDPRRRAELCTEAALRLKVAAVRAEAAGETAYARELRRHQRALLEAWAVGSGLVSSAW